MDRNQIKKRLFFWYFILWVFIFLSAYVAYGIYFVNTKSTISKWVGVCAGSVAILLAVCKNLEISFHDANNNFLKRIVSYFYNGVKVFLNRQNKIIFGLSLILLFFFVKFISIQFSIAYICGVLIACACSYVASSVCIRTNTRISHSALETLNFGLKIALNSGIVTSMFTSGISLIVLVILFHNFKDYQLINGFALGISLVALFSVISGAASKLACSNAKNVILNFFDEIQEDDRRNPLLLLNGISNSAFSLVGMSSELLESFIAIIIAAMTIGNECYALMGMFLPIIIASSGLFSSVFVILLTKISKDINPIRTLFISSLVAIVLFNIISFKVIASWMPDALCLAFSIILGSIAGFGICFVNANNIFSKFKPARSIANAAIAGTIPAMIQTMKESFLTSSFPCAILALLIPISFFVSEGATSPEFGIFGIVLSVLGMLSTVGMMVSINAFAHISNSVNIISKTYEEDYETLSEDKVGVLKGIGENVFALGKNFVNFTSVLASLAVLVAFITIAQIFQIDILNPYLITSLLLGTFIPFLYCGLILGGISKTASKLVLQVKYQFRNFPQILRFEMRPDYEKCVDVAALNSSIQVIIYTLIVSIILLAIGFKFGLAAMACFVFGVIIASCGLIFVSTNSSFVARAAKKYFEHEFINAQYSNEYGAIKTADSYYAVSRDIIAPSLNSLIKFLAILSLALIPMFTKMI
ncbi:MAG: sodium/proton-translocating pyrophosphatase [Candidatus Gastranaerophilales bacterium]|nr:sodium/proton-translocating pyrophosphatase [Candidatus Gastranaerophilales bacterium]